MSDHRRPNKRPWHLGEVLLFSVPPLLLALYVFGASALDYHRISQYEDWWSQRAQSARFMKFRLRSLLNLPKAVALDHTLSPEDKQHAQLDLMVDRREWDLIQSDAAMKWGEHVRAQVWRGGQPHPVKLRMRGDTSVHWTSEKKTLRLSSPRSNLFKGRRDWVFSVKEVLTQYVANSLSRDFDLLAPSTEIVPVYLNRRFYGITRAYSPVDEAFLRRAGRMPGNIFRGDTAERGEYFKGLPRDLFRNPAIWDRVARNDRPGATGSTGLTQWLELLNRGTAEQHRAFMSRMDRAELSRMLALTLLVGDPYHMSGVHNQLWYEDPSSGLMHPIVWDLRVLDLARPPQGVAYNSFWRSVLRDPSVLSGAFAELHARGDAALEHARELADSAWQTHRQAFEFDQLREGIISETGRPGEILAKLSKNYADLKQRITDARASTRIEYVGDHWVLDVEVNGWAAVELVGFDGRLEGAEPFTLIADSNQNGVLDSADQRLQTPVVMPPGSSASRKLKSEAMHYRLFVYGPLASATRPLPRFVNAHTSQAVEPGELAHRAPVSVGTSWHAWNYLEAPPPRPVTWSGSRTLTEDVSIAEGSELIIAPGAELLLGPDVSILARGKITALGTAARPIVFRQARTGVPWGTLALQGPGANGSRLTHVRFEGGGGAQLERVEYKGMVCVHWAEDVRFESCEFSSNQRCDDALNVVHSQTDLIGCLFQDVNADAVDYDHSLGMIRDNTIERAGNDGFDLMTCQPTLVGNSIIDCGDKGISIGERAAPIVFNNTISGCAIGIEVKDMSRPQILHCELVDNGIGLLSRSKNWRYGAGGRATLVRTLIAGNGTEFETDKNSTVTLHQSQIGPTSDHESPTATAMGDIEWLLGPAGILSNRGVAGNVPSWGRREAFELIDRARLHDDFERPEQHWQFSGAVRRLEQYEGLLEVELRGARGKLGLRRPWDLTDDSKRYRLVLELAGEGLSHVRAQAVSTDATAREAPALQDCNLGQGAQEFAFTVIDLAPGEYSGLFFEIESAAPQARLWIADWRVIAAPRLTWAGRR